MLGDGAKQSGGRRTDVVTTSAIPKALQQVADDLAAQYVVTYALPDGVKPDRRFSITTDRKGSHCARRRRFRIDKARRAAGGFAALTSSLPGTWRNTAPQC